MLIYDVLSNADKIFKNFLLITVPVLDPSITLVI
uniref:Photosystem II protein I n=1 Tax=Heterorhabditis bacteriophora TaxID=37862 RepID=A0A1I7X7K6_HETBA